MQANNDPKWTDDAAFWNEAWADMDKRLDQEPPPSRKAPIVWWRRYGWLLGLAFLITAVATPAAMIYLSQDGEAEQESISPFATPAPALPAVIAENDSKSVRQEVITTDQTTNEASITKSSSANAAAPVVSKNTLNPDVARAATSNSEETTLPTFSADNEAIDHGEQPTVSAAPANAIVNAPGAYEQSEVSHLPSTAEIPAAMTSLTGQPIGPIKFTQNLKFDRPEAVIHQPKLASRLYLDVGTSYGLKGNKVGYYAGLQYSLPLSKQFSIPVGLRFRRDFYQFVELAESGTPARFLDSGSDVTLSSPDTITLEFNAENLQEIVTTGFEGRIGIDYSPAPRWRIGASLSVNYLQTAIARVSSQYQAEFADPLNRFSSADADLTLVSNSNFVRADAVFGAISTPLPLGGSSSSFPKFDRWFGYVGLNVSYDLTQKLSVTLAGRRLLAQPDQSKVIGLQRGQLEIGARWRLK